MSDVWQGPGWWLASDGKWYPADAEPGAVYEGDLSNTDATEVDTTPDVGVDEPVAADPDVPDPAMASVDAPAVEAGVEAAIEVDIEPDAGMSPDVEPEILEPEIAVAATSATDPFAQMPAPVVEEARVGGWQAISEDEPAGGDSVDPEPDLSTAVVEEDGWTSAYEERQATSDVLDESVVLEAPAEPAIDAVAPDVGIPDVAFPDVEIPDVQVPEVAIPEVAIPDVAIPDIEVPDVSAPETSIPDVSMPDLTTPESLIADVAIPDIPIPDTTAPDALIPDVSVPDMAIPEVVPTDNAASIDVSDLIPSADVPDAAVPEVDVPDVSVPEARVSTVGLPSEMHSAPHPGLPGALPDTEMADVAPVVDVPDTDDAGEAPIERADAWRKPLAPDTTAPLAADTPTRAPEVVDLAIPDEPIHDLVEPPSRNWSLIGGILAALLLLVAIAWLIASLFSGNDTTDDVESTAPSTGSTQSTAGDAGTTDATSAPSSDAPPTTEDNKASVFSLRAGDCIVGDIGAGQVTKVEKVDCELEHQFEVYREALIDSSITSFDEEAISAYAEEVCRTSLAAYVPADDDRGLKFKFLQPTEDSWNQAEDPDRVITCLLFDDDAPLIGRAA